MLRRILSAALLCLLILPAASPAAALTPQAEIAPGLLEEVAQGETSFWVILRTQADLAPLRSKNLSRSERGLQVFDTLQSAAEFSQASLLRYLASAGYPAESFWIINAVHVSGPASLVTELARRSDVARLEGEHAYQLIGAQPDASPASPSAYDNWGLEKTGAPQVWSEYFDRGEGIVVASIDTGVQYDHPALVRQYRGALPGGGFNHNYSWFNAIDDSYCANGYPCDMEGHGTHVMGIMVGETVDLVHQTGMAPAARWISVRACTYTSCTDQNLLRAAQWLLAPTDLAGANPRPELRPDIINNSWGGGGSTPDEFFRAVVSAWSAAGIFSTFSAGNVTSDPSTCSSLFYPAYYPESVAVGGTAVDDSFYYASGYHTAFGPGPALYGSETKPDLSAPAESVLSSYKNSSYATLSGTSMASPHVAGAVALVWSSAPKYRGDIPRTLALLQGGAVDLDDTHCGGTPQNNNVFGEGRLDIYATVQRAHFQYWYFIPFIVDDGLPADPPIP